MTFAEFKKRRERLPDAPGVYFFLGPRKKILYIGKAASLRSRVRSYFSPDISQTRGAQIVRMVEKARGIDFRQTDSVLEALLLEANLIRSHKPAYNTDEKDDKSFNHVVITKEDYPRVLLVRGKELASLKTKDHRLKTIYGPFPHGGQLKEGLRLIRKIFPFFDTKHPVEEMLRKGDTHIRFNQSIGVYPGAQGLPLDKKEYARTIRHIKLLFQGRKKSLIRLLEREMKAYAKKEEFELAQVRRRQIAALTHIQDISLIKDEHRAFGGPRGYRIEAYDVAHLGGSSMVGVMTVVEEGEAKRSEYRTFRVRSVSGSNDTAALQEILSRRLGHDEWPMPRLIVVDGAAAQVNVAEKTLSKYGVGIPVVGVVKDERHRPRNILGARDSKEGREKEILLANAEAHRFAISYHRNLARKRLV